MHNHFIHRLHRLNQWIARANTGTPQELANKLKVSESQLYLDLKLMKKLGAPIAYCRRRITYYYTEDGCFTLGFDPPPRKIHSKLTTHNLH